MYLARNRTAGVLRYAIRVSVPRGDGYTSKEIFDLGPDPARHIVYPGGNAFYIHEQVEAAVVDFGLKPGIQEMEELFWPFVDPEIRYKLEHFFRRGRTRSRRARLSREEEDWIRERIHLVDKRRLNYIRLQQIDQTKVGRVPDRFYRPLLHKSRDEIEQFFIRQEMELKPHEYRTYVFSFFNLRRFFHEIYAGEMPEALDQEKLDAYFLEELCELNADQAFWGQELPEADSLHEYLTRYLFMYFDNPFSRSSYFENIIQDYINRHRFHRPPPRRPHITLKESSKVFGVSRQALKEMSRRELVRLYRSLALKHHPDQGGDSATFIELTRTFKAVLRLKSARS